MDSLNPRPALEEENQSEHFQADHRLLLLQQQRIRWQEMSYRRDYEEKITRYTILFMVATGGWIASNGSMLAGQYALGAVMGLYLTVVSFAVAGLAMNYRSYRFNHGILADVDERLGLFSAPNPLLRRTRPPCWGFLLRTGLVLAIWLSCVVLVCTAAHAQRPTSTASASVQPPSVDAMPTDTVPPLINDPNCWVAIATLLLFAVAVANLIAFSRSQKNLKLPVVVFRFIDEGTRFSYRLVNAGDGPAVKLSLRLGESVPEDLAKRLPAPLPYDDALPPDRGDPNLQIAFGFSDKPTAADQPILKDPRLVLTCEYEDVWRRRYRTVYEACSHRYERL